MHRSTGPVDRSQPRVGSFQSVDRSLPTVDRTGRPLRCACQHAHRSTGPVDRATASADGRPCACAAADFWFSSSSLRRLPRRLPPPTGTSASHFSSAFHQIFFKLHACDIICLAQYICPSIMETIHKKGRNRIRTWPEYNLGVERAKFILVQLVYSSCQSRAS